MNVGKWRWEKIAEVEVKETVRKGDKDAMREKKKGYELMRERGKGKTRKVVGMRRDETRREKREEL